MPVSMDVQTRIQNLKGTVQDHTVSKCCVLFKFTKAEVSTLDIKRALSE